MNEEITQIYDKIKDPNEDIFNKIKLIEFLRREKQILLKKISEGTGIKSSYLCHILRLKKLPTFIIDGYYSKSISLSHLFIISRLRDEEQMISVYEKVLADELTVGETEGLVREVLYNVKKNGDFLPEDKKNEFIELMKKHGIDARIVQTRIRGKIILEARGSLTKTSSVLFKIIKSLGYSKDNEEES